MGSTVPKLMECETLIWDQIGRSSHSHNPKSQHFNPEVQEAVVQADASVLMLPPYGKLLNPLELLFNDLKEHHLQPAYPRTGAELIYHKIKRIVKKYLEKVAPHKLLGFFRARGNGREAKELELL